MRFLSMPGPGTCRGQRQSSPAEVPARRRPNPRPEPRTRRDRGAERQGTSVSVGNAPGVKVQPPGPTGHDHPKLAFGVENTPDARLAGVP